VQFAEGGSKDDPTITTNDTMKKFVADTRVDQPFPMPAMTMTSAKQAFEDVLNGAGCTLPRRDAVDIRVIEAVRTGKVWSAGKEFLPPQMKGLAKNNYGKAGNGIITDPAQVGGYPEYKGEPIKDLGADGIPLSWKTKFNLDTNDVSLAQKDLQGDGYTVMDKYLAGLDPTKKIDWNNPRSNVNTLQ